MPAPSLLRSRATLFVCTLAAGASPARAQCSDQRWVFNEGLSGSDADVRAVYKWDRDGPGPEAAQLVVAGQFYAAGHVDTNGIAVWTGSTWYGLGSGVGSDGIVYALTSSAADLFAAGRFTVAGGIPASNVARWDGADWHALGAGVNGQVNALLALGDGQVIAGGALSLAGSSPVSNIALWDGSQWLPMGTGFNGPVLALARLPNGDIIAAGQFTLADGAACESIARWSGGSWLPMGAGLPGLVRCMTVLADGTLVAGGSLALSGGPQVATVARFDGSAWQRMGTLTGSSVETLHVMPSGVLHAGGFFTSPGQGLAQWNGTAWVFSPWAGSASGIRALSDIANQPIVAGSFYQLGTSKFNKIARHTGTSWQSLSGMPTNIQTLYTLSNGDLLFGGTFQSIRGVSMRRIARQRGDDYFPLGAGLTYPVRRIAEAPDGRIAAAGNPQSAGANAVVSVFDGTVWTSQASAIVADPDGFTDSSISGLAFDRNNDLVVSGNFIEIDGLSVPTIARKTSSGWLPLGIPPNADVRTLARDHNGDVLAGGGFTSLGGIAARYIARWDGTRWHAIGAGLNYPVNAIATLPDGRIFAAGGDVFTPSQFGVWNGAAWTYGTAPGNPCNIIAVNASGEFVLGGWPSQGFALSSIVLHASPASSFPLSLAIEGGPTAAAFLPSSDILFAGGFFSVQLNTSARTARWSRSDKPLITHQPALESSCRHATVRVIAAALAPMIRQWQVETAPGQWAPLGTAPTPLACGSLRIASDPTLGRVILERVACTDPAPVSIRCSIQTSCGSAMSESLNLRFCFAEFDCSGAVLPADIFEFLNAWFGSDPRADINGSGLAPSDIFDFLNAWFAGC